jgi:protein-disulfide isomerase
MHERLLASPTWKGPGSSEVAFAALADSIGLDRSTLEKCVGSADVSEALAADRALATAVDLRAVPTIYVDGAHVRARSWRALRREIERRFSR